MPSSKWAREQRVTNGIHTVRFEELAEQAKAGCPVSQALAGPTITLDAELLS